MAIGPDLIGGYGFNYARELFARNGPAAVRSLQSAGRATAQTIARNPRAVQAIVRMGGTTAMRAAGASGIEAGISIAAAEGFVAAGTTAALSEIIVPVALVVVVIWTVYECVSYWRSLPPKERGYSSLNSVQELPDHYVGSLIKSEEYGAPAIAAATILKGGRRPQWTYAVG